MFMEGADLKERDIKRAKEAGEKAGNGNLEMLLPKLKKTHDLSNQEVTSRQEKIISILKGDKLAPNLNSPDVRKHMRNEVGFNSAKHVKGGKGFNSDLIHTLAKNDSMQHIKGAFLTDNEESLPTLPTNRNSQVNSGSFVGMGLGAKKNSV